MTIMRVLAGMTLLALASAVGGCAETTEEEEGYGQCFVKCAHTQCGMLEECDCGSCVPGEACTKAHTCVPKDIAPDCALACGEAGRDCGDLNADCFCGTCAVGWECAQAGSCSKGVSAECNQACFGKDCGMVDNCDCGQCVAGGKCNTGTSKCECTPVCENADSDEKYPCGDDGCGGSCGQCEPGKTCQGHVCVDGSNAEECLQDCTDAGYQCGALGDCDCGMCGQGFSCLAGQCKLDSDCGCEGKECGDDGCGTSCGFCNKGACSNGICVCQTDCTGKTCGPDGCGGTCGGCAGTQVCNWTGQCSTQCNPLDLIGGFIQKVNYLDMAIGGYPGNGLDIDHDQATCAPEEDCKNGIDNQLSGLMDDIKNTYDLPTEMKSELDDGNIVILAEFVQPDPDGKPFTLNLYWGDTVVDKTVCNFQTSVCDYLVDAGSFENQGCQAVVSLDNATVKDGKLRAGGANYVMASFIDLAGMPFQISLHMLHVQGDVSGAAGSDWTVTNGIIGGAVPKKSIIDAIEQSSEEDLGMDKGTLLMILEGVLVNDIDSNEDGVADSLSAGFKFGTIAGTIVGLKE